MALVSDEPRASCGSGKVLEAFLDSLPPEVLSRVQVVANDVSSASLVAAKETLKRFEGKIKIEYTRYDITRELPPKQFDVVVIGGGPGGYIAAIRAAQLGLNTACIDDWKNDKGGPAPGGTCTNVGCIPSKALLQSSENFEHAGKHFKDHGIEIKGLELNVGQMLARKDSVVKQNNDGILYLFKKNKVSFFHGRGSFVRAVEGGYEVKVSGAAARGPASPSVS